MLSKNRINKTPNTNLGAGLILGALLSDRFGEFGFIAALVAGAILIVFELIKVKK